MGKPTGFMEFERIENKNTDPNPRSFSFEEFHLPLNDEDRMKQASRCMNCGVPFCSSGSIINGSLIGCPLENNIPEFNDLVYQGKFKEAYEFLSDKAPFPEFTGRVCPALCEAACTNKELENGATTNKDTELFIIENAFKEAYVLPRITKRNGKTCAVIGSGPSGLSAAYYLNDYGFDVTVFEKADRPGGLLMYGIPNMKLDKKIIERRVDMMELSGIKFVLNHKVDSKEELKGFDAVVFAGGTDIARDLKAKGRDAKGIYFAVDYLSSATKCFLEKTAFEISAKNKNVCIIGGGDTGNDCVATALRQGAKEVREIEIMPEPPKKMAYPFFTKTSKVDYAEEEYIERFKQSPKIYSTTVKEIIKNSSGNIEKIKVSKVKWEGRSFQEIEGSEETYDCDLLIISMGFTGNSSRLLTDRPENFFVCGDAKTGPSLVVKAIKSGKETAKEVNDSINH